MDTTTIVCTAVLLALLAALGVALAFPRRLRRRRQALQQRFGSEYERALEAHGSVSRAERDLAARARRVQRFHLHELTEADRARFSATWTAVQARFVDEPSRAVREANELIKDVMSARGYPVEDFDQRVADLSVDHANVVQHYRAARALVEANSDQGRANTEDLRQAMVHHRALFAELVQGTGAVDRGALQERHA